MDPRPTVAVLVPAGEDTALWLAAIGHGGGKPELTGTSGPLPSDAGGLLVGGTADFGGTPLPALQQALDADMPVLGVCGGMHAINCALGGREPVPVPAASATGRQTIFMSPGGKLSYTIAGSGWVGVPFSNPTGIRSQELSPALFASCYREDGFLAGIEMPGHRWVMGVQWEAQKTGDMPRGFDSLLLALCERAGSYAKS